MASVSAPVFDAAATLVAAVSVSGPANRIGALRGRRYAPAVTAAAQADRGRARRSAELTASRKLGRTCLAFRPCNARWMAGSRAGAPSSHRSPPSARSRSSPRRRDRRSTPCCRRVTANGPVGVLARLLFLDRLPHGVLIVIGFLAMISAGIAFLLVLWAAERGDDLHPAAWSRSRSDSTSSCSCCRCCSHATSSATRSTDAS